MGIQIRGIPSYSSALTLCKRRYIKMPSGIIPLIYTTSKYAMYEDPHHGGNVKTLHYFWNVPTHNNQIVYSTFQLHELANSFGKMADKNGNICTLDGNGELIPLNGKIAKQYILDGISEAKTVEEWVEKKNDFFYVHIFDLYQIRTKLLGFTQTPIKNIHSPKDIWITFVPPVTSGMQWEHREIATTEQLELFIQDEIDLMGSNCRRYEFNLIV